MEERHIGDDRRLSRFDGHIAVENIPKREGIVSSAIDAGHLDGASLANSLGGGNERSQGSALESYAFVPTH